MTLANTTTSYGLIARTLHWLTALLIFVAFPLGYLANSAVISDESSMNRAFALFSLHKTVGIMALLIGLMRLAWTLSQPRPAPLPHTRLESILAETTHWTLTIALIAVPLSGWLAHSASPGLAPIRWPFGQSLPYVPTDPASAAALGAIHWVFTKVLAIAVLLHIAGAMKHAILDRDDTLPRMTKGISAETTAERRSLAPALSAIALWLMAIGLAQLLAPVANQDVVEETREWPLADATISITDSSGTVLATATAFSFLLMLAPDSRRPEKGTLDITIPIDAMEGPGADQVLATSPFPLLTYSGTVSGVPPDLTSDGYLDLAGVSESAQFEVKVDNVGATVTGKTLIPEASGLILVIEAQTLGR